MTGHRPESVIVMYKVISKTVTGNWHVTHFNTKKEAIVHANQEYKKGCNIIELYDETSVGYRLIYSHKEPWKKAVERIAEETEKNKEGVVV